MPGWDDILNEIKNSDSPNILDEIRHKYICSLSNYTKRNVIVYYSGWLNRPTEKSDINDTDMVGFMNAVKDLDCTKGLDLIIHTPGGSPEAAESIVKYLQTKFDNNIRAIVPHLAMSAGTMIVCSTKEIIMGKQSSLGPIDPQFGGIPAYSIKNEFEEAKEDLSKNPKNYEYWRILLGKYPAAFVKKAIDAIELADTLLKEWLGSNMFDQSKDKSTIDKIAEKLNEHDKSKVHGRHFDIEFCKKLGLKIFELESDDELQDLVLSIYHAFNHSISYSNVAKIIENNLGKAYITTYNINK